MGWLRDRSKAFIGLCLTAIAWLIDSPPARLLERLYRFSGRCAVYGRDWLSRWRDTIIIVMLVFSFLALGYTIKRMVRDESKSCTIQARGLPAGHELATTMGYLSKVLIVPQEKLDAIPEPTRSYLKGIQYHSARYVLIEEGQPQSRRC